MERIKGLRLNKSTLGDRGNYACVGTMNGKRNHEIFKLEVYGMCKIPLQLDLKSLINTFERWKNY